MFFERLLGTTPVGYLLCNVLIMLDKKYGILRKKKLKQSIVMRAACIDSFCFILLQ